MPYLTIGIHYPKLEHGEEILSTIKSVADTARTLPGLIETGAWYDQSADRLMGSQVE